MITHQELLDTFEYNPITGLLHRHMKSGALKEVGYDSGRVYLQVTFNNKKYLLHRFVWMYVHGIMPSGEIDHINHDRGDNRMVNLRVVTPSENQRNMSLRVDNSSGTTGVYFHKATGKWRAQIRIGRKIIGFGAFHDKDDAVAARKTAEVKYGFHENHGLAISNHKTRLNESK